MRKKYSYIVCLFAIVFFCSCGADPSKKLQEMAGKGETAIPQSAETQMPENKRTPEPTTEPSIEPTEEPLIEPTEEPSEEPSEEPYEVIEKRNIDIAGRHYKYVVYARTTSGKITLMALKTDEDVLHIPSEIEGDPVVMLGWPEETPGEPGYQWSDQVDSSKLGWNWGKKQHLKKVIISEGIERIPGSGFGFVTPVDEIIIPKSMKEIGLMAFLNSKVKKVRLKGSKTNLADDVFRDSKLEEIQFPDDFSGEIGSWCFAGSNLKSFRWPAYGKQKITDMGSSVFEGCKQLKKITFPENQERIMIPGHSFFWCRKLTKLEFPASTKKVVYKATHYADNYKYGISTLIFKGKNTKVEGGDIRDVNMLTEVPKGKSLITVKKIIAPKNSKAIEFAKKAVKIADMDEWKREDTYYEKDVDHPAVLQEDIVPVEYEIR